jgi:hypothetical protein
VSCEFVGLPWARLGVIDARLVSADMKRAVMNGAVMNGGWLLMLILRVEDVGFAGFVSARVLLCWLGHVRLIFRR